MPLTELPCDSCGASMQMGPRPWHFVCPGCGLERSTLEPRINDLASIDEIDRERALAPIRDRNFGVLLAWIGHYVDARATKARRPRLLDVGCAHGWFVEKAQATYDALGLEPDEAIATRALARNLPVRGGYFPQALRGDERFDAIVFNDVLEHIPDVVRVLQGCSAHLADGGIVVVNAPDCRGLFYRLSKLLCRLGRTASFDRMWQVGMPSPHLYYFDTRSLAQAAGAAGFDLIAERTLSSIVTKGLYARIRYAGNVSGLRAALIAGAITMGVPLIRVFPSDISVWVLKKRGG